jgi:chromosome partitioning protein
MKTISILNQKGGVGKTTIAVNLCYGIAVKRFRVLLVDADPQGSVKDWQGIAGEGAFSIIHYAQDDLYKEISALGKGYDHIVIDGPPGKESVTKSILTISDLVIIPVRPSILDLWSSREIVELVTQAREIRPLEGRLLVSQKAPGTRLGKEARESLSGLGLEIFETEISLRIAYAEAMISGRPVMEYDLESEAAREIKNLTREVLRGVK